jgi:hypothetical protein
MPTTEEFGSLSTCLVTYPARALQAPHACVCKAWLGCSRAACDTRLPWDTLRLFIWDLQVSCFDGRQGRVQMRQPKSGRLPLPRVMRTFKRSDGHDHARPRDRVPCLHLEAL